MDLAYAYRFLQSTRTGSVQGSFLSILSSFLPFLLLLSPPPSLPPPSLPSSSLSSFPSFLLPLLLPPPPPPPPRALPSPASPSLPSPPSPASSLGTVPLVICRSVKLGMPAGARPSGCSISMDTRLLLFSAMGGVSAIYTAQEWQAWEAGLFLFHPRIGYGRISSTSLRHAGVWGFVSWALFSHSKGGCLHSQNVIANQPSKCGV